MTDKIVERVNPHTGFKEYYAYIDPDPHFIMQNYEKFGEEYRGFKLLVESVYLYWTIKTLDDKEPPIDLQGNYTGKQEAKERIDWFLMMEARRQKDASEGRPVKTGRHAEVTDIPFRDFNE